MVSDGVASPTSGDGGCGDAHLGAPPPLPARGVDAPALQLVTASSFTYTPYYCEENAYFLCKHLSLFGVADREGLDLFVVFISNEKKQAFDHQHSLKSFDGCVSSTSQWELENLDWVGPNRSLVKPNTVACLDPGSLLNKVPFWHQKASKRVDGLVIWDYHVICIQSRRNGKGDVHHLVWDLDSSLPFPLALNEYAIETFQPLHHPMPNRLFRLVHAPIFLRCFASDRAHMKDPSGSWISPPPTYNPIVAEDGTVNNIHEYIQIGATDKMVDMTHIIDSLFARKFGAVVDEVQLVELFSRIYRS